MMSLKIVNFFIKLNPAYGIREHQYKNPKNITSVMCQVSCVMCHMSHVACLLSHVPKAYSHSQGPTPLTPTLYKVGWFEKTKMASNRNETLPSSKW